MVQSSSSKHILLVEDEIVTANYEVALLNTRGYRVTHVLSGNEAVALMSERWIEFDLILMDIDLGMGMDGTETAEKILQKCLLPVLFLSSHTEPEIVEKTEKLTSYGYVVKNTGITVLDASIKMAFKLFDAEQKLRDNEERYKELFYNSSSVMLVIDPDNGNIVDANKVASAFYGYSVEELLAKSIFDINVSGNSEISSNMDHVKSKSERHFEFQHRLKNGELRDVEVYSGPISYHKRTLLHSIIYDITEKKEALLRKRRLFKLLEIMNNISQLLLKGQDKQELIEQVCILLSDFECFSTGWLALVDNGELNEVAGFGFEQGFDEFRDLLQQRAYPWCLEEVMDKNELILAVDDEALCASCPLVVSSKGKKGMSGAIRHGVYVYGVLCVRMKDNCSLVDDDRRLYSELLDGLGFTFYKIEESQKLHYAWEELHTHKRRYDYALAGANDGLFDWNLQDNTIYYSPRWKGILGYEDDEIKNEFSEWERLTDVKDVEESWTALREHISGKSDRFEKTFKMKHKDGHWVDVLSRASAIYDESGEAIRIVGTHVDVSEQKKVERQLRLAEKNYRMLFESMPIGLAVHEILLDEDGRPCDYRFLSVNPSFEKITGLHQRAVIGKTVKEVLPAIEQYWIDNYGKVALTGEVLHFENYSSELDRYYKVTAYRPAEMQFAVFIHDMTDSKKGHKKIESLLKEKDVLLREVHHRIKNNIANIKGLLALQLRTLGDQSSKNAFQEAIGRLESMQILYEKMYKTDAFSSVSSRDYLTKLIHEIAALYTHEKEISLELDIDDVSVDSKILFPLGIIINEFYTNAVKYAFAESADPAIRVALHISEGKGQLTFADNGVGIDTEVLSSGGLVMVRLLVQQIGGELSVKNEFGTTCILRFPLAL